MAARGPDRVKRRRRRCCSSCCTPAAAHHAGRPAGDAGTRRARTGRNPWLLRACRSARPARRVWSGPAAGRRPSGRSLAHSLARRASAPRVRAIMTL